MIIEVLIIGMDISPIDLINIQMFASRVIDMFDYRKRLHEYLHSKIEQVAPNLSGLIGDQVTFKHTIIRKNFLLTLAEKLKTKSLLDKF